MPLRPPRADAHHCVPATMTRRRIDGAVILTRVFDQVIAQRKARLARKGEGHALLTVTTTSGDYILDNLTDRILPWDETDYKFLWRQAQFDPNIWVALGDAQSLGLIHIDRSRPPMVIAPRKSLF